MSAAGVCPFHSMWYAAYSDLLPKESASASPTPSSQATTPGSLGSSPFFLPSTCICPPATPPPAVTSEAHKTSSTSSPINAQQLPMPPSRARAVDVLRAEARAMLAAAERLSQPDPPRPDLAPSPGGSFDRAVEIALNVLRPRRSLDGKRLRRPKGKLVWCGVGKSGLIGRKLHATSLSLGLQSAFLHPIEALHGDLGMVEKRDVVIILSNSGATSEVLALTPHLKARGARMIALCGKPDSELVLQSDAWVDCRLPLLHHPTPRAPPAYYSPTRVSLADSISTPGLTSASSQVDDSESSSGCSSFSLASDEPAGGELRPEPGTEPTAQEPEAWATVPAPSSSTTLALAMGDALVFAVAQDLGHGKAQFARNHPNGDLGRQLRLERELAVHQQRATDAAQEDYPAESENKAA